MAVMLFPEQAVPLLFMESPSVQLLPLVTNPQIMPVAAEAAVLQLVLPTPLTLAASVKAGEIQAGMMRGPRGSEGPTGVSAYMHAVQEGFIGTISEWLLSLKGAQGDVGERGLQGVPGPALSIQGELTSIDQLPEAGSSGEAYLIDTHLWSWSGSAWVDCGVIQGPKGLDGIDGANGESAYNLAVAAGFVGDLNAWLLSLKGEQGVQGEPGASTWGSLTGTLSDQVDLAQALSQKQDTLESGVSIRTLNGQPLLGAGNIVLETPELLPVSYPALTIEALLAGDFVHVFAEAGVLKVRKATASGSPLYKANGFVLSATASGAEGAVFSLGNWNTALTGLTLGASYFLSVTVPGGIQDTPPDVAATLWQELGVAISATTVATINSFSVELG